MKKLGTIAGTLFLTLCLFGCLSTSAGGDFPTGEQSVITERDERMFWEIKSPTGTTVYVYGTINVGTPDWYQFDDGVLDALEKSSAMYAGLSFEDMQFLEAQLPDMVKKSVTYDEDGKPVLITNLLDDGASQIMNLIIISALREDPTQENYINLASTPAWYFKKTLPAAMYETFGYLESDVMNTTLIILGNLNANKKKEIIGLSKPQDYLDLYTFGTMEQQVLGLQDLLFAFDDSDGTDFNDVASLTRAYEANDKETMRQIFQKRDQHIVELYGQEYADAYFKQAYTDFNRSWADQIATLLQQKKKTYFVFGATSHWLGQDNVFDMLVADGVATW